MAIVAPLLCLGLAFCLRQLPPTSPNLTQRHPQASGTGREIRAAVPEVCICQEEREHVRVAIWRAVVPADLMQRGSS